MGHQKSPETLAKFLGYVLGRRPDEFGLVPDPDGYVKIKELLKALGEEEGWRHVRRAGIDEVLISVPDPPVEVDDNRIRAVDRSHLPERKAAETFPKLLYTCVRKKAHPVVVDRGVSPMGEREHVVLTTEPELAERLGRRIDSAPLLLTVHVQEAVDLGVLFQQVGESIYLAPYLPVGSFTAPPLPQDKKEEPKSKKKEKPKAKPQDRTPGSFFLDADDLDPEQKKRKQQRLKKKDVVRDKERKQSRRQKNKLWPE
ncbi:MAG: RNA 2'-phosphotransferase [Thermodesulfobacteriota bacterium]